MGTSEAQPIGMFIDVRDGLGALRIMIVEVTATGRVMLRRADGAHDVAYAWPFFMGDDLDAAITSLFARYVA